MTSQYFSAKKLQGKTHKEAINILIMGFYLEAGIRMFLQNYIRVIQGKYNEFLQVMNEHGDWITKSGNGGKSTMFPDSWDEQRIIDEVTYVVENNRGRDLFSVYDNEYFGYSDDGKIQINFYIRDNFITFYFPKKIND